MKFNERVSNGRATQWALVVFVLGLAAALAMVFVGFDAQSFVHDKFDPYSFGEMGESLARGEGFAPYGVLLRRRAPLYPLVIGGVYLLFGEHPRIVQLLQCVLFAGTCWLVFDMGRRVFSRRTAILAGLFCALHPLLLRYVADLHLETLLTFLFTLSIWCTVRFYERPTFAKGTLVGATAALAALTKAVVLLYPAFFVVAWAVASSKRSGVRGWLRLRWGAVASIFVALALFIAPWTARNYLATGGRFVPVATGLSDAFLRGYVFSKADYALLRKPPYTDAENECNAWFRAEFQKAGAVWERDDYETDQVLNRVAKEKLLAEPGEFLRKFAVGLFTFWYEMTSLSNSLVTGGVAFGVLVLAGVGAVRSWREERPAWLFVLPALQLNVLLAALLALGRYSAPIMPALLVVSAYGADSILARWDGVRT